LLRLEERLPRLLRGQDQPGSAGEALELAVLCYTRRRYAAAGRFFGATFAADPRLADNQQGDWRFRAACSAALAAAGQGADGAGLDANARLALRRRALTWLRADLTWCRQMLQKGEVKTTGKIRAWLQDWQNDPALASLRDPVARRALSAQEQQACRRLWDDVRDLLDEATDPSPRK
jgi:hypothetical protein